MASVEVPQPPLAAIPVEAEIEKTKPSKEDTPKAAPGKGVPAEDDSDEQILFSCNICYEVSKPACVCAWDMVH